MKITVLGCGRWGSFLAWYCSSIGHQVKLWGRQQSESYQTLKLSSNLQTSGINEYIALPKSVDLTSDFEYAVEQSSVVLVALSAQNLRDFLTSQVVQLLQDKQVVLCMKGIESDTGMRLTQVANECGIDKSKLAVWVGPGHIQDFAKNIPNCMVIDSVNIQLIQNLVANLKSKLIRFYYGEDLVGTELGAATKNVIGILAGILDGAGLTSLKGPLMSRGAAEVSRLIKTMGGNPISAYGLCHLGDYETTLFSLHSNNRNWGEAFVKGLQYKKLAEGVATAKAIALLGKKKNIDLPLTYALSDTLNSKIKPQQMLDILFERTTKIEFY